MSIYNNITTQPHNHLSGFGDYADTQYDANNKFSLLSDTITDLPNNAGLIYDEEKPADILTFYDGSVITGRNGDGLLVTIDFLATPTSASTSFIEVWIDITGGTGTPANLANLYKRLITFPKGQNIERPVNFTFGGYTRGNWETNGAVVKVLSNGTCDIHNIRYVLTRTHKAK
jgi:hypothetical protein